MALNIVELEEKEILIYFLDILRKIDKELDEIANEIERVFSNSLLYCDCIVIVSESRIYFLIWRIFWMIFSYNSKRVDCNEMIFPSHFQLLNNSLIVEYKIFYHLDCKPLINIFSLNHNFVHF